MKIHHILSLLLLCAIGYKSTAQQQTIENVRFMNRLAAFATDSEVNGYYCFYQAEKAQKGKRVFQLHLFDQDLNPTSSSQIIDDKNVTLRSGANTGNTLMLLFVNPKERKYTFRHFDTHGEEIGTKTYSDNSSAKGHANGHALVAVNNKGFAHYHAKTSQYILRFISDKGGESNNWEIESKTGASNFQIEYLSSDENTIISLLTVFSSSARRDGECFVIGNDIATGKEIFRSTIEDNQYAIQVTNGTLDGDQIHLFGNYFPKNAEVFKAKSLGLCAITLDLQGKVLSRNYSSWSKEINAFLPANEKGKITEVGYLYFHDFIKTADGKVFGIAESFRRAADGWGIASAILSPGSGNLMKIVVENLYVFEYDASFSLQNIGIIQKEKTNISSSTAEWDRPQAIANYIKNTNGFDYAFNRVNPDRSGFRATFLDYGNRGNHTIGIIQYDGDELSVSHVAQKSTGGIIKTLPAKPGFALIYEHFLLKKRRVELRLEEVGDNR